VRLTGEQVPGAQADQTLNTLAKILSDAEIEIEAFLAAL
jgi:hypothetical protein